MNSLPQMSQSGLRHHGGFDQASMASRQLSVNSYESLDAGLTIRTREGDVVTLSTSQFSELNAYEYDSQGEISGKRGSVSAAFNTREITLSSGELFSFSVKGDLSEDELKDIEAIVAGIDEIIGEMAEGDMDDAVSKALSMGSYDSISKYEADIQIQRSYSMSAETRSEAYTRRRGREYGLGRMSAPEHGAVPEKQNAPGNPFMDRVAALLEQQKEDTLARAGQPLSKLFDYHLEALKKPEANDPADAAKEIEKQPVYRALESAAKDVDQIINRLVKQMFQNTLDQMI